MKDSLRTRLHAAMDAIEARAERDEAHDLALVERAEALAATPPSGPAPTPSPTPSPFDEDPAARALREAQQPQ